MGLDPAGAVVAGTLAGALLIKLLDYLKGRFGTSTHDDYLIRAQEQFDRKQSAFWAAVQAENAQATARLTAENIALRGKVAALEAEVLALRLNARSGPPPTEGANP